MSKFGVVTLVGEAPFSRGYTRPLILRGRGPASPNFWDPCWHPYGLTYSDPIRHGKTNGGWACL